MPSERWGVVGRDAELAAVGEALRTGAGALLVGEAGVGKTRLAAALADAAAASGQQVVRLCATGSTVDIPLGALAPVFRASVPTELRADLLATASDALVAAAGPNGLVVCDDAQLLDDGSAAVLAGSVRTSGVTLLATARAGSRLPDALAQLWQSGSVARLDLAALDHAGSGQLLRELLGGEPHPATERRLLGSASGNPLLLRELVLGAREADELVERDGWWVLTTELRPGRRLVEIVEARLEGLQVKEREAVELLALAGSLRLQVLERLTSPSVVEQVDALGFLTVTGDGEQADVQLHHPLHDEVLRGSIPATRRRRLHQRLAADLAQAGARTPDEVLRLARWSLDGGRPVDAGVLLEGARLARFAHDLPLAERLASAAEQGGAGVPALLVRAESLYLRGRHADADALLSTAEPTSADEAVVLAVQHANVRFWGLDDAPGADAVLAEAAEALGEEHRAEGLAFAAQLGQLAGHPADALDRVEPFLDDDGARAFIHAANAAIPAMAFVGRCADGLALIDRTRDAWLALGDQLALFDPGILFASAALTFMELGRLADARSTVEQGHQLAVEHHTTIGQAWMALVWGRVAVLQGDLAEAERRFAEGHVLAEGYPGLARWGTGGRLLVAAVRGDAASCVELEAAVLASPPRALMLLEPEIGAALAWSAAARDQPALAVERFAAAFDRAARERATTLAVAVAHDAYRATGEPQAAGARRAEIVALAASTDCPLAVARAAHLDAAGRRDPERHEASAEAFAGLGARIFAAEAWASAAQAWRRAGEPRRANRCARAAQAAHALTPDAATPLLRADPVAVLTAREQEAIRLARHGLATKEIASRMGVRPRTAENHLHRAYEKLGVSGKLDLSEPG